MPIHEYTCRSCHAKFDKLFKSFTPPEQVACPECGSLQTQKQLSNCAVGAPAKNACPVAESDGCGCGCGCGHHH